jgi:hypothetical protein
MERTREKIQVYYSCCYKHCSSNHNVGDGQIKNDVGAKFFILPNKSSKKYEIILKQSTVKTSTQKRTKKCLIRSFMTVLWGVFFILGVETFSSRNNGMISFSVDAFSFNFRSCRQSIDLSHSSFSFVPLHHRRSIVNKAATSIVPMNAIRAHDGYPVLQHDNLQIHEQNPLLPLMDDNSVPTGGPPIDERIQFLLSDDNDEENDEIPDYSEKAANEIADKTVYSRISEQAKWKANITMKNSEEHGRISESSGKRNKNAKRGISNLRPVRPSSSKVTASVQETGGDSMSEYVKSMASHELLSPESEVLLGRHIQLLVQWEALRMDLEKEFNRQVFCLMLLYSNVYLYITVFLIYIALYSLSLSNSWKLTHW